MRPGRSLERAEYLESVLDGPVVIACLVALVAVVLQLLAPDGPLHTLGLVLSWAVWVVLLADAVVMATVHPAPLRWARGHWFELAVLVVAFPLWPLLAARLEGAELVPVLELLEASKLAKVAKVAKVVHARGRSRPLVIAVVLVAAAVFVHVLTAGG